MVKGWKSESARHSLARKGMKTGRKTKNPRIRPQKTYEFYAKNYTFKKENSTYKLSLGNLTTAGWFWTGDKTQLGGYFHRIAHSTTKKDFLKEAKEEGLKYSDIKADVIRSIEKDDDGIYQATGDNKVWHFGEEYADTQYELEEFAKGKGYKVDDIDPWSYYEGGNYDEFKKSYYYGEAKAELLKAFKSATTFKELFNNLNEDDFTLGMIEATSNFQNEKFREALNEWEKKEGKKKR